MQLISRPISHIDLKPEMLHHVLGVLHADLHVIHMGLSEELLALSAIPFLGCLDMVDTGSFGRTIRCGELTRFSSIHSTVFQSEFVDYDGFTLIWQRSSLSIDVSVVSVTDDLAVGKLDFSS